MESHAINKYKLHIEILVGIAVISALAYLRSNKNDPIDKAFDHFQQQYPSAFLVFIIIFIIHLLASGYKEHKKGETISSQYHFTVAGTLLLIGGALLIL